MAKVNISTIFKIAGKSGKLLLLAITLGFTSCEKIVEVRTPFNAIISENAFLDEAGANSAIAGMYSSLTPTSANPPTAYINLLTDMLADNLSYNGTVFDQYKNNSLVSNESNLAQLWATCYAGIYRANAIIEGISNGKFSTAFSNQAIGEALFIRSFCYFYLTNLYGDVPLITTTQIAQNQIAPRTPSAQIVAQIVSDLERSAGMLPENYPVANRRQRANKWAATAFLARVYLYTGDNVKAEQAASQVISKSTVYSLPTDLATVFLTASTETIFAFDVSMGGYTLVAAFSAPSASPGQTPSFIIQPNLYTLFETNDKRRTAWTGSNAGFNFALKYKSFVANTENDVVFRLAEQYLIRAEARAKLDNLTGAQSDINIVRQRAGVTQITTTSQISALEAVAKERRLELFSEWGHRWLDLKRTQQAGPVISALKPGLWQATDVLYPIPNVEREKNVNLTQNPGYF